MYPPRKTNDLPKPKSPIIPSNYQSPPHKDANKVNKILQNAKKYEQNKQQKRDYMLEGIMSIRKKQSEQQQIGKKKRESELSNRDSDNGQQPKKDIYRRVENSDQNRYDSNQRAISRGKQKQYIERDSKKITTGNQYNAPIQNYRNQNPMVRESDKYNQNQVSYSYQNSQNKYETKNYENNNAQLTNVNNQYVYKTRQQESQPQYQYQNQQISSTTSNNQAGSPQYAQQYSSLINSQQKYNYNNNQISPSSNPPTSTYNKVEQKTESNRVNTQLSYSNNNNNNSQLNRVISQPQLPKKQENTTNTQQLQNSSSTSNLQSNNLNKNQNSNTANQNQLKTTQTVTSPTNSANQQKIANQTLQSYNNTQSEEQKRQLAIKNYHNQQYLQKLQSGEIQNAQNKIIKQQMDKLINQASQMRNKFYRAQEQRVKLAQKCKIFEEDNHKLRSQNQQLKLKVKSFQFQIGSLKNYKNLAQNQIKQIKGNNQSIYEDMMKKNNEITIQLRKKCLQVTKFQRISSELEAQLGQRNYQCNKLKQLLNKKQEQALQLQQKQYQLNKLNFQQNKTDTQIKSYTEKISFLQKQLQSLKDNKNVVIKLQNQISKLRKQMQEMVEDMKDLELQLQTKDKVILQYKNYDYNNIDDNRIKMIEQQLQTLMKQKNELTRTYQQKLLQKDKKIAQIQAQHNQPGMRSQTKINGLQAGEAAFQQILRQQTEQITSLKRQNYARTNDLFATKMQLQSAKSQLQNSTNKIKILNIQMQNGAKNAQSITQSHLRAARNQIQSLNRRIQVLNNGMQAKRKQNQNKDEFIRKYLLGSNKVDDVTTLVTHLERVLNYKS